MKVGRLGPHNLGLVRQVSNLFSQHMTDDKRMTEGSRFVSLRDGEFTAPGILYCKLYERLRHHPTP
jgi:hypothetical protein